MNTWFVFTVSCYDLHWPNLDSNEVEVCIQARVRKFTRAERLERKIFVYLPDIRPVHDISQCNVSQSSKL